jgi:hypothetical protein
MGRRAVVVAAAVLAVGGAVVAAGFGPAAQWLSVRRSADPDVARAALECMPGSGRLVTQVLARPWGWTVRSATWPEVYLGRESSLGGNPNVYVVPENGVLVPWYSGSYPPFDPVTKVELTAPGAADAWEADIALAVAGHREPLVARRCSTRSG